MEREYRKRIADAMLQDRLDSKGAVLIEGPKWCGKTTTATQAAGSILYMQDPARKAQNLEMAQVNPALLLAGAVPRLIDEWQLAPKLWDAVRFMVDQRNEFGQFILTGSAVPADMDEASHTGTGRISRMKMRPMSLFESGDSSGTVSLADLFAGRDVAEQGGMDIGKLAFLICRGGWPMALGQSEKVALRQALDYYDAVVESDVCRVDGVARNAGRTRLLMRSYARSVGSQTKFSEILKDIQGNDVDAFGIDTLYSYVNALKKIFVIEDAPAWNPNLRSRTAIRTTDTRYFADPSIAAAALGVGPTDLLDDLNTMGLLFENLCVRDLRVYADALDGTVYHYRDKSDLECDAVVHLRNGGYGLVEIKLGGDRLLEEGVKSLLALNGKLDTARMKPPAFMMVLAGTAPYAYRRPDGVYIVPADCLRP